MYPEPASELKFSNDYQLLLSVMLSAQTTDKKVNEITPGLFKRFPNFQSLSKGKVSEVENLIRGVNYHPTKAKHLVATAKLVLSNFGGKVPDTYDEILTLPGVGRKTANVVLSERGVAHAIAVDTHVFRVARRLGLSKGSTPRFVEEDLMKLFPENVWRSLHHWLILHGRRICKARRPLCETCPLNKICPSAFVAIEKAA